MAKGKETKAPFCEGGGTRSVTGVGAKSYNALSGKCEVQRIDPQKAGEFSHINNVNRLCSLIAGGFAFA